MSRFYHLAWDELCQNIARSNIIACTAAELLDKPVLEQFVVLKHDVETNPKKALELAQIESRHGLRTSYYVQAYLLHDKKNLEILHLIQNLGHEVSYHYDVLDSTGGDFEKALIEFKENLDTFHSNGFRVKTICQHGNPVKKRIGYTSNRDFFRKGSIANQFPDIKDIMVNFKEMIHFNYTYISDAGYGWNIISNPENDDRTDEVPNISLNGIEDIEKLMENKQSIIISIHPHRWQRSKYTALISKYGFYVIRTIAKKLSRIRIIRTGMNRFYHLAKKI